MKALTHFGAMLLFLYYLASNISYFVLLWFALAATAKHRFRVASMRLATLKTSPFLPPISIIVPARNEQLTIVESVRALLGLDYPELEVIVVNDGSTDSTLAELQKAYDLRDVRILYVPVIKTARVRALSMSRVDPRLTVIDKENGGSKADAINAGINAINGAYMCVIDADSILENDALLRIMSAVFTETAAVMAAGGIVRVVNGCTVEEGRIREIRLPKRPVEALQVIEYLRAFLIGREGWARFNMLPLVSGAFGVFRTELVRNVGGFRRDSVGEDLDLVVRLHRFLRENRQQYRIAFVPDPTCWTEVPSNLSSLARQRTRWQKGLSQVLWSNRDMLFRPRYGRVGFVLLPYLWIFEWLEPVVELFGYVSILIAAALGTLDRTLLYQILLFGYGFAILISMGSVLLEEMTYRRYQSWQDVARLIGYCFVEHLSYRQLHLLWRLRGLWEWLTGTGHWNEIRRSGFERAAAAPVTEAAYAGSATDAAGARNPHPTDLVGGRTL